MRPENEPSSVFLHQNHFAVKSAALHSIPIPMPNESKSHVSIFGPTLAEFNLPTSTAIAKQDDSN
jgi:hypothetical protein